MIKNYYDITEQIYSQEINELINLKLPYEKLYNKCILITGGTGAIGRVIVDFLMSLCKKNSVYIKIIVISRDEKKARDIFEKYWNNDNFIYFSKDVTQKFLISGSVDYIFHAASNTHPIQYAEDPIGTIITNVVGTYNLLMMAEEKKAEFILFSSVEVYGENTQNNKDFSENDFGYINCASLRAGYPEGKRVSESLCYAFSANKNVKFKIMRLARVYGATMFKDDSKAISQFFNRAIQGEQIELKSSGEQLYSYIYVMDCVSGIFTVLLKGNNEEVYNISGTDSVITLKELAQLLGDEFQVKVIRSSASNAERKGFSKSTCAVLNNEKLRNLGWEERTSIYEGMKKMRNLIRRV